MSRSAAIAALLLGVSACGGPATQRAPTQATQESLERSEPDPRSAAEEATASPAAHPASPACGGAPLTVHFFDVGQALAVLVKLPDSRTIMIDTGESPTRPGCGVPCKGWNQRLLANLPAPLGSTKLDALWITHQHSDHLGGVPSLLAGLSLGAYFDNGHDLKKAGIVNARKAATGSGAQIVVQNPGSPTPPLSPTVDVKLTPVMPAKWPVDCSAHPNECSMALRIDYCKSSMLFTGDAEGDLEKVLDPGEVSLLQVGHHGSATSSSEAFLLKVKPKYAVISSGKPEEGTNRTYCHPREVTVEALSKVMGGAGSKTIKSFDGKVKCAPNKPANWVDAPANDSIWSTASDGDVVLVTKGDGVFERVSSVASGNSPGTPGTPCCKTCTNSKPCGDTCIQKANACSKPPGCACASPTVGGLQ